MLIVRIFRWCKPGLLMLLGIAMFGCTRREPIVLIDGWWSVDYAKNGCWLREHNGFEPCIGEPAVEVRDFAAQLRTAFATDGLCRGVVLADFEDPKQVVSKSTPEVDTSKMDWQVMLNFKVGESSQGWTMVHHSRVTEGHGSPREIVHTVCAIVKHADGS